ncbi:hypothetical protein [Exiguobacterium sp. s80]|uniref:hypothetical protein n=1 Tax=Exiguobacterium sp. s80 TaxID=2751209 RepID=UPI001BEBF145|nr:hypothetical protein [Exiguobacterium sp. s80]
MPSKLFITFGSGNFVDQIRSRDAQIWAASGNGEALLWIETDGKSPFQSGNSYTLLETRGNFDEKGTIFYWSIPADQNSGDLFIHQVMSDPKVLGAEYGSFQALRIARVERATDLVLLIQFKDEGDASRYAKSVERLTVDQYAEEAGKSFAPSPIMKRYQLVPPLH